MAVILDIRNPTDLTTTYDQITIQRATSNSAGSMSDLTTISIDTTTASDLSTGYTSYTDADGEVGTHYYRFKYKISSSGAVSSWSDIFAAGTNVLAARFRRMMRDANSNNYFFTDDDLDFFLEQAVHKLWPITWFETYDDSSFVPDGSTEVFNFPIGVTRITDIDFLDSSGNNLGAITRWRVRGRKLLFEKAPASGYTIRAWVEKRFLKLGEVPEIWDSHLLNIMRLQAFETFEADRSKYYKYTSVANPEGGNLPSISKVIERIETQIKLRETALRRVRTPATINMS